MNNYPHLTPAQALALVANEYGPITERAAEAILIAAKAPIPAVPCEVTKELYGYIEYVPDLAAARREAAFEVSIKNREEANGTGHFCKFPATQEQLDVMEVILGARAEEAPQTF